MANRWLALGLSGAFLVGHPAAFAQASGTGRAGVMAVHPLDRIVAVVGKKGITLSELYQQVNDENARRQANGQPEIRGADTVAFKRTVLDGMIDAQLLLQKAEEFKFPIKEEELTAAVDQQIKQIREQNQFKTDKEFLDALRAEGLNSVEELKRRFTQQERERQLQKKTVDTLTKLGQMPTISVSEKDIEQAFDSLKVSLAKRGPTVTFRQIVIKPKWTDSADARALALADSLLSALKAGASFDSLARAFSDDTVGADTSSAKKGGDLGWFRRGRMVEAFDRAAFSTPVGQLAPLVKTEFGYHIIRVDRARAGEVRARHILIMPKMGVGDVLRVHTTAEKLIDALKAGASFDSLAELYHDPVQHTRKVNNLPLDRLPPEYVAALSDLKVGEFSKVFDVVMPEGGFNKAGLLQLLARNDTGDWTLAETRQRIRADLQQAGSWHRLLDQLRKQTYVSIRL